MTADLLTRAREAVTVKEEALVVFEAVQHSTLPAEQRRELCRIVMMAGKEVPRAVLLGAVAALVPEGWTAWELSSRGCKTRYYATLSRMNATSDAEDVAFGSGQTPAIALLIALLEAGNVEA